MFKAVMIVKTRMQTVTIYCDTYADAVTAGLDMATNYRDVLVSLQIIEVTDLEEIEYTWA